MEILHEWKLLEAAFDAVFHQDLEEILVSGSKTWRWFRVRVAYLLDGDNPLSRRFAPSPEPPVDEMPDFD